MSGPGQHRRARRGFSVPLAWVAVGVVLQLLRQDGAPAIDTVWGEDGPLFLAQAVREGPLGPVLEPSNGYILVLARLLGGLISLLPLRLSALAFAVIPALIVSGLSIYVFAVSREFLRTTVARAALALLVVIPPPGVYETTATVTSLQWNLLVPCFLAIAVRPRTRSHAVMSVTIAGVSALSAPVSLVLAPVSIWRLARRSTRWDAAVHATFLVASAVQILLSLGAEQIPPHASPQLLDLPHLFALRVGAAAIVGHRLLTELWPALHWTLALGGAALLLTVAIVCFRDRVRGGSLLLLALGASATMFAAPVYLRGQAVLLMPTGDELMWFGARWEVGPVVLLAMVLISLADRAWAARTRGSVSVALLIGAALATATITSFRDDNLRSSGPRWSHAFDAAAERCADRAEVKIPITPRPWVFRLPCHRLVPAEALGRGGVHQRGGVDGSPPVG